MRNYEEEPKERDERADQWSAGGTLPDADETWSVPPHDLDATWPIAPKSHAS